MFRNKDYIFYCCRTPDGGLHAALKRDDHLMIVSRGGRAAYFNYSPEALTGVRETLGAVGELTAVLAELDDGQVTEGLSGLLGEFECKKETSEGARLLEELTGGVISSIP